MVQKKKKTLIADWYECEESDISWVKINTKNIWEGKPFNGGEGSGEQKYEREKSALVTIRFVVIPWGARIY
jgi:hypothetical protein